MSRKRGDDGTLAGGSRSNAKQKENRMAVDVDLLPSTSLNNIDTNFQRVESALQNVIGRSGTLPNQMNADLDMNSNDVLNIDTLSVNDLMVNGVNVDGVFEQIQTIIDEAEVEIDADIATINGLVTETEGYRDEAEQFAIDAAASAAEAEAALVYNPVIVRFTTTNAGPYDMGVGNEIGSANNIDIKIGGVEQDHNTYNISGTTFTFTVDPGAGLPMEAVIRSDARSIATPANGSVTLDTLSSEVLDLINGGTVLENLIFADRYGAIFDDSPGDRALIKQAAMYAINNDLPFVVPNRGLEAGVGITIQVPEDVPDLQDAINAIGSWIFPRNIPDQDAPYAAPWLVTISVEDDEIVTSGHGFVWNLPKGGSGDLVLLKGRNRVPLAFVSFISQVPNSGIIEVTLEFASLPTGIAASEYLNVLLTYGTGEHAAIRGCWQISNVNVPQNRLTFKVNYAAAAAITMTITDVSSFYLPSILRFINMPFDGADRAGIDIQENCCLNMQDIVLSGDAGGTNAVSTQGVMVRKHAVFNTEQYVGIYGFQRAGVWFVENGNGRISFSSVSFCDTGLNLLSGSSCINDYGVVTGNLSNNIVVGIGSTMSAAPVTSMGSPGTQIYILNGGSFITSLAGGFTRIGKGSYGVVAESGGVAHLNDAPVVNCSTIGMSARAGSLIVHNGGTSGNAVNHRPAINTTGLGGAACVSSPGSDL